MNVIKTEKNKLGRQAPRSGFLANISTGWKMTLMVFVLFLGILGVTFSAYAGLQSLRYQLSNIYDFMLVPIVAINNADAALADVQYAISQSYGEGLNATERAQYMDTIASGNQKAQEIVTRYDTEWVTTVSPEFTQALRDGGKLDLQKQEVGALADYHAAYDAYRTSVDKYLATVQSGNPNANLAKQAIESLLTARAHLLELITINNQYAEFSNNLALDAFRQALINGGIVLVIAAILGLVMSYLIAVSITSRLGDLTRSAASIQGGNLDQPVIVAGRDELGLLGTTFNNMAKQLKEVFGTLEQRVADRTKALATSSAVSRRLSTILNRSELVSEVVNQVRDAFGYYHAHIYLIEANELVMAGGTGDAGVAMLASGHKVPKGRGLVGRAAESNKPVLVQDTSQDPGWLPNPLLPETKSEVAIPISAGDEVLGVLDVQHNVKGGLGQEDVDSLTSIANQVAIAMKNIESAETVSKRAKELETVASISTATATIQDTFEMLATMVHLTQRGFGLYHAHVFLYREDTDELQIVACGYKEGDEHEGTHGTTAIPMTKEVSLVARAGRTRQPVIVNDVSRDPSWLPNPLLPDTQAELAVPLIVGNTLLGVLDVQSDQLGFFTEEDANIQMTLASQVATALQNARSFTVAQKQAEEEAKLNLIAQKIQSTTSVEAALQVAARELGHALGYKPTLVTLNPAAQSRARKGN